MCTKENVLSLFISVKKWKNEEEREMTSRSWEQDGGEKRRPAREGGAFLTHHQIFQLMFDKLIWKLEENKVHLTKYLKYFALGVNKEDYLF